MSYLKHHYIYVFFFFYRTKSEPNHIYAVYIDIINRKNLLTWFLVWPLIRVMNLLLDRLLKKKRKCKDLIFPAIRLMCILLPGLHAKNMDLQRAPIFLVAKLRSIPWSGQGCPLCRSVWACPGHPLHPPDLAVRKYPAPLLRPYAGGRSSSNRAPRRSHRCPKTPTPPRTEGRTRPPGSAAFRSCSSSAHSRICPGVGQKITRWRWAVVLYLNPGSPGGPCRRATRVSCPVWS